MKALVKYTLILIGSLEAEERFFQVYEAKP